jgi:hypothetical protein
VICGQVPISPLIGMWLLADSQLPRIPFIKMWAARNVSAVSSDCGSTQLTA